MGEFYPERNGANVPDTIFETRTKIVGVTQGRRQSLLAELTDFDDIDLIRERNNPYDPNAIAVRNSDGRKLGYVRAELAEEISDVLDENPNAFLTGSILEVTGGKDGESFGCNIEIAIIDITRDLCRTKAASLGKYSVVLWTIAVFGFFLSLAGFGFAWPIGFVILGLDIFPFATGCYYWKMASHLEKVANGQPEPNTPKKSAKRRFVVILAFAMATFAALLIGCAIFSL